MKRVKLSLAPYVIVADDVDVAEVEQRIVSALMELEGVEAISVGRHETSPARAGHCLKGGHEFFAPAHFPADRPVPSICPQHSYSSAIDEAQAEHAPLFDEVERLTGMKGSIWQSGGMTMTMVWGNEETGPCYLGLQEGVDEESGAWGGSAGYYSTPEQLEDGESVDVVDGTDEDLTPVQWAEKIAAHFATLPPEVQERLRG